MTEDKRIIELPPILNLPPINMEQMHPYAAERYLRLLVELYNEVPLDQLSEEDLTDDERAKRKRYTDEIIDWAKKCDRGSSAGALMVYLYSMVIFYRMSDLKALLKTAYERKLEELRQETEKKKRLEALEVEKKRRLAALEEMGPPLDDAKKYLKKDEYEQFCDSISGAISAYVGRDRRVESYSPRTWLLNRKASDYSYWTLVIRERKEKEVRRKQAQLEHDQYLDRLSLAVEKFKGELAKSKKPKSVYPPELEKYEPDGWCELDSPSKQQIRNWAESKILERLPEILANLTKWELTWQVRVLPHATYEVEAGIPCLTWYFQTHILVAVNLELKKCVIRKRHPGYTVEVQAEGEKLGSVYLPVEWLTPGSFTTPIPLLFLLSKGESEAPGITVTDRSPPFMTFAIQGLEEEVELYDGFRRFIRDICKEKPLTQALLDIGVIDVDTASLVKVKWNQPLPVSGDLGDAGGADLESVVAKLVELGKTEAEAKEAVETTNFPKNATIEEMVNIILQKSH